MTTSPEHQTRTGDPLARPVLLDRAGRLWRWTPGLARELVGQPGVFCHHGELRTEREIEQHGEPVIEVRDPRVLTARLRPVPVNEIRLNDVVVLPGMGELSPVIGVFPAFGSDCGLYVCTDNGDWARRSARSPVLRAELPIPDPPP